jgi:hypothetical protein
LCISCELSRSPRRRDGRMDRTSDSRRFQHTAEANIILVSE